MRPWPTRIVRRVHPDGLEEFVPQHKLFFRWGPWRDALPYEEYSSIEAAREVLPRINGSRYTEEVVE